MNRKHRMLFLPLAVPVVAALLGGCTYADRTASTTPASMPAQNPIPVTTVSAPAPVVVSPAPTPVVVSPAPTQVVVSAPPVTTTTPVVVAPTTTTPVVVSPAPTSGYPRVVNYAGGRYQLYGDAGSGYYWVWIPAGATSMIAPQPPAVPRTNVVLTPAQRQVVYAEGRYELYGDGTSGYYWAWIPSGVTPPAPPPPWRISQQQGQ